MIDYFQVIDNNNLHLTNREVIHLSIANSKKPSIRIIYLIETSLFFQYKTDILHLTRSILSIN